MWKFRKDDTDAEVNHLLVNAQCFGHIGQWLLFAEVNEAHAADATPVLIQYGGPTFYQLITADTSSRQLELLFQAF